MVKTNELSNERKLIILASRLTFSDEEKRQLITLVNKELNWHLIFGMALKNKVLPLIWHNIKNSIDSVNKLGRLRRVIEFYYIGNKKRNEAYFNELKIILDAMVENNIRCVPVKGAFLIPNVYENYNIRTVNDIDFLIEFDDIEDIIEVMKSIGYTQNEYDYEKKQFKKPNRRKQILWKTKMNNLLPFKKISDSEFVNITNIDFSYSLNFNRDIKPVNIMINRASAEQKVYYLEPNDFFVHQCCHHYKEASNAFWIYSNSAINLIKFCDTREYILIYMKEDHFDKAIAFAEEYNFNQALYFTLYYLKLIYNDGYEDKYLNKINIEDKDFLYKFGKKDFGENILWKKDFWDRMFAYSNTDEIKEKIAKYSDIVDFN